MICEVKNFHAGANAKLLKLSLKRQGFQDLQVDRAKRRKASTPIARADKVVILIDQRIRKTGSHVEYRCQRETMPDVEISPKQEPVRRVVIQQRTLIAADNRIAEISKV